MAIWRRISFGISRSGIAEIDTPSIYVVDLDMMLLRLFLVCAQLKDAIYIYLGVNIDIDIGICS